MRREQEYQDSSDARGSDGRDPDRAHVGDIGSSALREIPDTDLTSGELPEVESVSGDLWPHLIKTLEPRKHKGFAVKALQTALEIHGYSMIRADGFFGNYTVEAVIDFQANRAANLIDVDGVVGPLTWLHLIGRASHVDDSSSEG